MLPGVQTLLLYRTKLVTHYTIHALPNRTDACMGQVPALAVWLPYVPSNRRSYGPTANRPQGQ